LAGLLGRALEREPDALVADEHAAQSTRSTSHGTTGRRSTARRIGPHLRGAVGAEPEQV
jgi:kynureninase